MKGSRFGSTLLMLIATFNITVGTVVDIDALKWLALVAMLASINCAIWEQTDYLKADDEGGLEDDEKQ